MEAMRKMLVPSTALAAKLNAIQPLAIDHAKLAWIGQGGQPLKVDPLLASTVSGAQRTFEEAMRPFGGIGSTVKQFEEQRAVQKSLLASLAGPFGDIAKTSQ
ncbi:hypothetical protein [Mesorhizobium erdmanii]|uniref:hypothetical protein n=1 Tax=Mesorhizobium erdmanii TaxID=1777866 RepID=UPI00040524CC|nr:hypothetical protein [Mesorhizobium erdmanii]